MWTTLGKTKKSLQPEIMDTQPLSPATMAETLAFLRLTNTALGGNQTILRPLQRWARHWPRRAMRFLDVGTGGGDIPLALARWAGKNGLTVHITAIDIMPDIVKIARRNTQGFAEISVEEKNLFALPPDTYDYVTASLFLHHVPPPDLAKALLAMNQRAARGLILADLNRNALGLAAVWLAGRLWGNDVVRHDGPLSVRRGFTPKELRGVLDQAGLSFLKLAAGPVRLCAYGERV